MDGILPSQVQTHRRVLRRVLPRDLCSAIPAYCTPENLCEIYIEKSCAKVPAQHIAHYLVSVEEIRPLFAFQNLVWVSLAHSPCINLDDDVATEMARSWPRLLTLSLHSDMSPRITPRMTLEGIAAFAEHCPRLTELTILFDATDVPELKVKNCDKCGQKIARMAQFSLEQLHVAYSPVSAKPEGVAEFLRTIFPCLLRVKTPHLDRREAKDAQLMASKKGWTRVQDVL